MDDCFFSRDAKFVIFELLEIFPKMNKNGKRHCIGKNINLEKTIVDQSTFSGRKFNNKGNPPSSGKIFGKNLVNNLPSE